MPAGETLLIAICRKDADMNPQRLNNRWYDRHEKLGAQLEALKHEKAKNREKIVAEVLAIINDEAANLLEKYLLDFPLDQKRRRWYDKNPYLWLMVNGLQHAGPALLKKISVYFDKTLKPKFRS
jgi:hypothetical protein